MTKLSQITPAGSQPALSDQLVGVLGGANDRLVSITQLIAAIGSNNPSVVNVKDFGADGRDRLYTNIVGGSGYTGGSASNLAANPEDATAWAKTNVTVVANVIADPRGNLLADSITETAANGAHSISDSVSSVFLAGATVRSDIELKSGLRTWVEVILFDGSAGLFCTFNLTGNGVVGSALQFNGALFTNPPSIQALPNGWYRCTLEGTLDPARTTAAHTISSLLGDLIYYDTASDPNQFYTGNAGSPAFYQGLARIYAIKTYLGGVYIASDNIFTGVALTGGTGTGARANITVGLGQVLNVTSYCPGSGYLVGDTLSCAAADIGGTGSGFISQVQTIGNDSVAVQAAIDSGNGAPVTVYFPAGTYNIFPPDNLGSPCLILRHSNVRMVGAGRKSSVLQFFVSGGRHPETSYDVPAFGGNANFVWRGNGFFMSANVQSAEWRGLRITGMCKRHNNRYPLGGADPQVISAGIPLGTFGDGDGWDESHLAISRYNRAANVVRGLRISDCEIDSWKGEIIGSIGDFTTPVNDSITQWTWWIEDSYLHDTHADCISSSGNVVVLNNEIAWASNGMEEGDALSHNVVRNNHFHDHTHGITLVVGVDAGAAATCTGQQIVANNFFERCYRDGIFVFEFQCNVLIDANVFADCGVSGAIAGGAVNLSLLSGSQPYANVFVRNNIIYNHARNVLSPLGLQMGLFTGGSLKGVYIENNRAAVTPAAQALGYFPQTPWVIGTAAGTTMDLINNDMRIAVGHEISTFTGTDIENNNYYGGEVTTFKEIHTVNPQFDKTSNALADIPGFVEQSNDSSNLWFEAVLFIAATAGGAQVAVVTSAPGGSYSARYDVEMWAGTTIDAASGQSVTMGAAFASAASITKIKITGYFNAHYGGSGSTLKLQFAQNSANVTPSSVLVGSWFKVRNSY
jgi:hypothetical protein